MSATLDELARHCGGELRGDAALRIERVATVEAAGPHDIVFVAGPRYGARLRDSRAGAVIGTPADLAAWSGNAILSANPRLAYTRVAELLHPAPRPAPGVHPRATVAPEARLGAGVAVAAGAVIDAGAELGAGVAIGAGCYIGPGARIGPDSRLHANVVVAAGCVLGARCVVHAGAVIGSDGFGFARDGARWVKTPQLGRVVIGDDVEIGANTAIDRGAIADTVIERGVKLDNLIHIAHNCVIGEDTAIAACVGIAGSTRVGKRCTLAGQVGVVGHIEIADDVHVMGAAVVSHSIREPGTYAGSPLEPYNDWLRNAVRMRQLDDMARRLRRLEQKIESRTEGKQQ